MVRGAPDDKLAPGTVCLMSKLAIECHGGKMWSIQNQTKEHEDAVGLKRQTEQVSRSKSWLLAIKAIIIFLTHDPANGCF